MAVWDDGGWLHLGYGDTTNGVIIKCKKVTFDDDDVSAIFIDYPDDGHYAFGLDTKKRVIKCTGIWFDSNADFDTFMGKIDALQTAGVFDLRVQRNSDGSFRTWNGTNITMPVLYKSKKGIDKEYDGDSEIWVIKQLLVRQAGALKDTNS